MFSSRLRRMLRSVEVKSLETQGTTRAVNSGSSIELPICSAPTQDADQDYSKNGPLVLDQSAAYPLSMLPKTTAIRGF